MFLDAEIQKRFPIHEKVRWCVIALLWIIVDFAVLYCGYLAYVLPTSLPSEVTLSWRTIVKPVIWLIYVGGMFLAMLFIARRKQAAQGNQQHETHWLKTGLKDVVWASICFVLIFSFLDTGFVPLFYLTGVHTYAGIYAGLKFVILALVYLIFFNGFLYRFRKSGLFHVYFMLFFLFWMTRRGDLSLQIIAFYFLPLGDLRHYFGEWVNIAVAIYILMYIIPFYIWSFMNMVRDLKSPYFQITDLHVVKNSGVSIAFHDIKTVEVVNLFAIFGMYGVQCASDIKSIPLLQRGLLLFWFDKDTAHALKDYLQERVGRLHAK